MKNRIKKMKTRKAKLQQQRIKVRRIKAKQRFNRLMWFIKYGKVKEEKE